MKQRPHAEVIKAWADGAQVQYRKNEYAAKWTDCDDPAFVADYEYRVKPAEPERVYPKTTMSEEEIQAAWGEPYGWKGLCAFANVALRHAIDHGQVVTREEFDRAVGDRAKRDMAIFNALWTFVDDQEGDEVPVWRALRNARDNALAIVSSVKL